MIIDKETVTAIGVILTAGISLLNLLANTEQNKKKEFINTVTSSRIKWINDVRETITDYIDSIPKYNYYLLTRLRSDDCKIGDIPGIINESFNVYKVKKINAKLKLLLNKDGQDDKKIIEKTDEIYNHILQGKLLVDMCFTMDNDDIDKFSENLCEDVCRILISQESRPFFNGFDVDLAIKKKISRYYQEYNLNVKQTPVNRTIEILLNDKIGDMSTDLVNLSQIYLKKEWERVKNESESGNLSDKKKNKSNIFRYLRWLIICAMISGIIIA